MCEHRLKAFTYYGGKLSKLDFILPQLATPHKMYVELFAGSLAVLLNKPRVRHEVVNDLAEEVVDFWKAVREHPDELLRVIDCSPAGEAEFKRIINAPPTDDLVEKARRFYVQSIGGYSALPGCKHHSFCRGLSKSVPLQDVVDRMRGVIVEQTDAARLITRAVNSQKRRKSPKTILFYADPPYTMDSRVSASAYIHDDLNHDKFLDAVLNAPDFCKFAISGYDNKLYNDRLADWHRHEIVVQCVASRSTKSPKQRTEVLWRNYVPSETEKLI